LPVVLYTRADCPLCDEMKRELARARPRERFELREVDVDSDPVLAERHGLSVPVLEIAGRPAFVGRLSAAEFEAELARRARELAAGGGA